MDKSMCLNFDKITLNDRKFPHFGEIIDYKTINNNAVSLCSPFADSDATVIIPDKNEATEINNIEIVKKKNNIPTKANESKSISLKSSKKTENFQRRKGKKSIFVAEYQASQIPDNRGSILSIDDLVKFVNGTDNISKINHKLNRNSGKCVRKQRSFPRKREIDKNTNNDKTTNNKIVTNNEELIKDFRKPFTNENQIILKFDNDLYDSNDDGDFYQVVAKRKNRHNNKSDHSETIKIEHNKINGKLVANKQDGLSNIGFSFKEDGNIKVDDKVTLNNFINKLWTEFLSGYQEYIRKEGQNLGDIKVC